MYGEHETPRDRDGDPIMLSAGPNVPRTCFPPKYDVDRHGTTSDDVGPTPRAMVQIELLPFPDAP